MRIALDTNILAYAEGVGGNDKCSLALSFVEKLPISSVLIPAQSLGELFRVLNGKAGYTKEDSRDRVLSWVDSYEVLDSTWTSFQSAFDLSADHNLQIWDALILSVAAESRCRLLLSEDFQEGFTWRGVTIVNPFLVPINPLLQRVLK